ncbi:MAG: hypothetical protein WKF37_20170 [Bryobacteraceae bacterium]
MPAALLMTSLQARVQVLAESPPEVAEMLTRLNRITTATCPEAASSVSSSVSSIPLAERWSMAMPVTINPF